MKRLSSTSNSKPSFGHAYAARYIIFTLLLTLVFAISSSLASYTQPYAKSGWRVQENMVNEFYASPENSYNLLFLGTSHSMCSFVPYVFDGLDAYDIKCYNLGGSSTLPDTSYYLLRDALDRNDGVKMVVFDMFYLIMSADKDYEYAGSLIWRPMPLTVSKICMFFDNFTFDEQCTLLKTWINPFYRLKNTAVYNADIALGRDSPLKDTTGGKYMGKGFYTFPDRVFDPIAYTAEFKAKPEIYNGISSRQKEYVKKIASLCRERGVTPLFVSTPLSPTYRSLLTFINQPMNELSALADECGVELLEYNRDDTFLSTGVSDADYADRHHFNLAGAEKFSRFFAGELKTQGYLDAFLKP